MTHLTEDDLTLLYYGELTADDERAALAHIERCSECRERHAELLRLFAAVDACPVPELPEHYEVRVWRRLQTALGTVRETRRRGSLTERLRDWFVPSGVPRWAAAGGLVAIIAIAFLAGRFWPWQPERPVTTQTATGGGGEPDLRERVLLSVLGDHFDRTQAVLVELANTEPTTSVDISADQRRASDLLAATRLYRHAAIEAGDRNVAEVLEALERVLAEITMSPSKLTAYELSGLQRRIEEQELLFKLRVASSAVRQRQEASRDLVES